MTEDRRSVARSLALAAVAFVATLILLFGLANIARPGGATGSPRPSVAGTTSRPSVAAGSADPSAGSSAAASGSGLVSSAAPSGDGLFPSPSGDPVLVGAGDIADCALDDDGKTADLIANIPGTVFTAGDNAYPDGTIEQYRDCYGPTWGRFKDRTRPAPGNHDSNTKELTGYVEYFGAAAEPEGTSWYSYDLGTWHVIVLDGDCGAVGGCGADSPQGRWLTEDLRSSTARCTVAIWHQPRFSSGVHGNDTPVAPFWTALYAAGADLVLNGHDHDYERFAPQDPDGREDRVRGIREFVVGTGGAALRDFAGDAPNSELRASITHGVIRLELHPTSYGWTFIPTSGHFGDAGSGPCH